MTMEQVQANDLTAAPAPAPASPARRASSATLWVLRLLVRGGILPRLLRSSKQLPDDVRKTLEMPELDDNANEETLRGKLAARLAEAEAAGANDDGIVFRNL